MKHLQIALKEIHRRVGLYLEETEHTLVLKRGQLVLARFSAEGATIESIQKEADKHTEELNGRDN